MTCGIKHRVYGKKGDAVKKRLPTPYFDPHPRQERFIPLAHSSCYLLIPMVDPGLVPTAACFHVSGIPEGKSILGIQS
jgi:hypothetical protein